MYASTWYYFGMRTLNVAVLRGGPSDEYEVSIKTGAGVLDALSNGPHTARDVVISRKGEWLLDGFVKRPDVALSGIDVVFIALHGAYGEDGGVQRLLERLGVPYTGSGPLASGIAMNKVLTKQRAAALGIKTPQQFTIDRENIDSVYRIAHTITELFSGPVVVKPQSGGSSIDTQIVSSFTPLAPVLDDILSRHSNVLVEEYIKGREATVGILEQYRDQRHYILPVIEIVPPASAGFFSADVKYTGETDEICPGRFMDTERTELSAIAKQIHTDLNLRHYSRSDFIVTSKGIYFLEVNTLPGLTSQSLFPKSITAVGGTYADLVHHLISIAYNK